MREIIVSVISCDTKFNECCHLKFIKHWKWWSWTLISQMSMTQMLYLWHQHHQCYHKQLQTNVDSGEAVKELRCDSRDAARSLHDETHLHVREAVLFSLGAPLICCSHVQVEAQRHRLLPQLGIPSEERALPLFYHLVNLLRPGRKEVRCRGNKRWRWHMMVTWHLRHLIICIEPVFSGLFSCCWSLSCLYVKHVFLCSGNIYTILMTKTLGCCEKWTFKIRM